MATGGGAATVTGATTGGEDVTVRGSEGTIMGGGTAMTTGATGEEVAMTIGAAMVEGGREATIGDDDEVDGTTDTAAKGEVGGAA